MNPNRSELTLGALRDFLGTDLDEALAPERISRAAGNALQLFHDVARDVPAYAAFLKDRDIDPRSIHTIDDFRTLPDITKNNYVLRNQPADLCRLGRLEDCDMMAVSSGSTGKPTFWPRFVTDEFATAYRFEQVFRDSFSADTRRTLAVVCFALGTWVGGMYTASCCRHLAAKGYPITVVTPGNNKEEILRVTSELGQAFEQVVLLGYPPFLKDLIDTGLARGIDWPRFNVKLVMAGEVFSEEWRALVCERVGATSPCFDTASLYGTADAGVVGNETPLSICIRRWLASHPSVGRELFGESRLPTLVQYDPCSRYFEAVDGGLLFTGDNGAPLVRYNILDTGGVIEYDEMLQLCASHGFDPVSEATECYRSSVPVPVSKREFRVRELPFVYVFGRSDFTVSYFGANIYPENVTVGLEQPGITEWVTGKFVLESLEDENRDRFLSITVELAAAVIADEQKRQAVTISIVEHLARLNSEFSHYVPNEHKTPRIHLKPFGDPSYFPVGVKHRYTRRKDTQ